MVQYSSQNRSSEGGAKNPSKGISMKFLVLAADAQLGVSSESKERGRSTMACGRRPFLRGDQFILMKRGNLRYCMQIQLDSVACLEWCRRIGRSISGNQGPVKGFIAA